MHRRWMSLLAMVVLALSTPGILAGCGAMEEENPLALSQTGPGLLYFYTAG
mgnify:CR=1 FL=1